MPRQILIDVLRTYGHELCDDPRRCRALLNDLCPGYKREVNVLIDALEERVAQELLHSKQPLPDTMVLEQLTRRLMDHRALVYTAARWSVESWALALGVFDRGQGTEHRETKMCGKREYVQEYDVHNHIPGPRSPVPGPRSPVPRPRSPIQSVAFSPDGHSLAVSTEDGAVLLWRIQPGHTIELLQQLRGHRGNVYHIVFSPNGHTIASSGADTTVRVWDSASGRELRRLVQHQDHVYSVAFSPDGQLLASGGVDKALCLWDATRGYYPMLHRWKAPHYVWSLAFSADGQTLASAGADKHVYVWTRQGHTYATIAQHLQGHTAAVWCVAFQHTAYRLASVSADGTVRLWNLAQPNDRHANYCSRVVLHGHTAAVRCVAFSPDGQHFASGSIDGTLCLWHMGSTTIGENERCIACIPAHVGGVYSVAFSPDASLLASGGADGHIRLWVVGERLSD